MWAAFQEKVQRGGVLRRVVTKQRGTHTSTHTQTQDSEIEKQLSQRSLLLKVLRIKYSTIWKKFKNLQTFSSIFLLFTNYKLASSQDLLPRSSTISQVPNSTPSDFAQIRLVVCALCWVQQLGLERQRQEKGLMTGLCLRGGERTQGKCLTKKMRWIMQIFLWMESQLPPWKEVRSWF